MISIEEWLENPDYWQGVDLYEKYGSNGFLKKLLREVKNPYNENKLYEEVSNLKQVEPKIIAENQIDQPRLLPTEFLNIQKKLNYQLQQIFRAIDNNMFQLSRAKSDNTRKDYALQILKLQTKKFNLYKDLDYLEEHGALPSLPIKKDFITPEIQRLHVQISKAKKRLLQDPDKIRNKAKTENLIAEKQSRLKILIEERKEL